jgi:hypothetical protein
MRALTLRRTVPGGAALGAALFRGYAANYAAVGKEQLVPGHFGEKVVADTDVVVLSPVHDLVLDTQGYRVYPSRSWFVESVGHAMVDSGWYRDLVGARKNMDHFPTDFHLLADLVNVHNAA